MVGRKHAFTYDHQGNRKTHSRNSHTTTYTPNNLNQYTARTNHGHLLVEGTSTNATVKVYETGSTEDTATRKNNYYFRDWDPDTASTSSDYPEINIKEGTTVSATKNAWIPAVSESPTYDANGNLTADALWSYTYDEENRLIQMTETSAAATAGFPDTTITFKYDYLGRRVEKKVVRGTNTESHLRFVWRGWLLVAELNAASNNDRVKTYTWGPDISGSFGGAGGNGGVLMVEDHEADEKFFPAYDAQGNVTGLIDTSGNLDAAYEYDPFGKLIRYAGTRTASMSLLYGTKYLDMETGLIYYGYRYYDPRQGRFINRDPIGEFGGLNLYGFVGNSPVNWVDYLGLAVRWDPDCEDEIVQVDELFLQKGCWVLEAFRVVEDGEAVHELEPYEVIATYEGDDSINLELIGGLRLDLNSDFDLAFIDINIGYGAYEVYDGRPKKKKTDGYFVIGVTGAGGGQKDEGGSTSNEIFIRGVKQVDQAATTIIVNRGWGGTQPAIRAIREAEEKGPVKVDLYGYSRGAITAVEIANRLNKMNIEVNRLTTIDPVTVTGLFSDSIDVPPNVKEAINYYQGGRKLSTTDFPGTPLTEGDSVENIFFKNKFERGYEVRHENMPGIVFFPKD